MKTIEVNGKNLDFNLPHIDAGDYLEIDPSVIGELYKTGSVAVSIIKNKIVLDSSSQCTMVRHFYKYDAEGFIEYANDESTAADESYTEEWLYTDADGDELYFKR